jgi:Holliday junction resolvase RusA-like endonuclease
MLKNKVGIKTVSTKKEVNNLSFLLNVQALSVNKCWKGRHHKTQEYSDYEELVYFLLPGHEMVKGWVSVEISYGCKNYKMLDVDNLCKPLLDIIVKRGLIEDDRKIRELKIVKFPARVNELIVEIKGLDD